MLSQSTRTATRFSASELLFIWLPPCEWDHTGAYAVSECPGCRSPTESWAQFRWEEYGDILAGRCLEVFLKVLILLTSPKTFRCLLTLLLASALSSNLWAQSLVGEVVAIADGDTLTVLDASRVQHKIRLAGIDAPERKQPFGQRSRQMLADLVFRKQVEVMTQKRDRYGRTIGKVMYRGHDVNLTLVSEGMAWHYKQYAREQDKPDREFYAKAEDKARAERRGLWADPQPIPPWSWRSGIRNSGQVQ